MKTFLITIATLFVSLPLLANDVKPIYDAKCASCHGKEGKGDTKMGAKLGVRDYSDPKIQEALKDEEMHKAIKEGVKKDGKTVMKGFSETLTEDQIKALVSYIRTFKKG
jgi:mono/diheme cytochrome c family protein